MSKSQNSTDTSNRVVDTNASPSAYGWCFQVGAGITLMLDNVKSFNSLKIEGASDDIEITTETGKIYAQAKSVTQIGNRRNASRSFNDAMRLLKNDSKNADAIQLVYITNIENPLSSKSKSAFQYDRSYEFSILPSDAQSKIKNKGGEEFPTEKFLLYILSFFGTGNNKFESVKEKISEFLRDSINDHSYSQSLLNSWFETFMLNAADKPDIEKKLELSKRDVIVPVIILVINQPINEYEFSNVSDYDNYDEICQEFRETINRQIYDYEFFASVIADYLSKLNRAVDHRNYKYTYVKEEWSNYEADFSAISDATVREALIKLLLLTVINNRNKISKIREATNLC